MRRILTGKQCQCVVCGEVFSTESNFDLHRFGDYAVGRYCLPPESANLVQRITQNGVVWCQPSTTSFNNLNRER